MNHLLHCLSGGASILSRLLPLLCDKWRLFLKQQLMLTKFNRPGNFKEWLVLRSKLKHTHKNVGAKVQPHQPSLLIVFPTQMLKYL